MTHILQYFYSYLNGFRFLQSSHTHTQKKVPAYWIIWHINYVIQWEHTMLSVSGSYFLVVKNCIYNRFENTVLYVTNMYIPAFSSMSWKSWLTPMYYLNKRKPYTISVFLRTRSCTIHRLWLRRYTIVIWSHVLRRNIVVYQR